MPIAPPPINPFTGLPITSTPITCADYYDLNDCGVGTPGDQYNMIENYMDYSADQCMTMFSQGQVARMQLVLENSPLRKELKNSDKAEPLGPLVASFTTTAAKTTFEEVIACINNPVTFIDNSVAREGTITTWQWDFDVDGIGEVSQKAFSGKEPPAIVFQRSGTYTVKLSISDGTTSHIFTRKVIVASENIEPFPLKQNFDDPAQGWSFFAKAFNIQWFGGRLNNNIVAFVQLYDLLVPILQGAKFPEEEPIQFFSPVLNVQGYEQVRLSFDVAHTYSKFGGIDYSNGLEIAVSTNCTESFERVWYKEGEELATRKGGVAAGVNFVPTSEEWRTESLDLTESELVNAANGVIAFRNLGLRGNNLYLDNIFIEAVPLFAPENLQAVSDALVAKVTLSWDDKSQKETSYELERSFQVNEGYVSIASLPANSTSFEDTDLEAGKTYYYRVRARNAEISSDFASASSNTVSVVTGNIEENEVARNLLVYPNPASEILHLEYKEGVIERVVLEDVWGRVLFEKGGSFAREMSINTKDLAQGMYILSVYTPRGRAVKRVVIQ